MRLVHTLIGLALVLVLSSVSSAAGKAPAAGRAFGLQYTWHDGAHTRTVYLSPNLIAEFDAGAPEASPVKQMYPTARVLASRQAGVRLWRLPVRVRSEAAARALSAAHPSAHLSPVFHDGPSASARKRALPGGVVVSLDPTWDATAVDRWAAGQQLRITRALAVRPNTYVVETAPGVEALRVANRLVDSGTVQTAAPVWWVEAVAK